MSNQSVHDEVCDLLPNELYLIVLDYMGNGRFWKHIFNRCLLKVEERIRGDDTAQSYYLRTGIICSNFYPDSADMSVIPNLRPTPYGRCDNIIYIALEPYFIDYDYRYDDLEVFRDTYRHICLINEYVGWIYDFEWHWDLTKPFQAIVTGLIE